MEEISHQEGDLQQDKLKLEESELHNYNIICVKRETALSFTNTFGVHLLATE